MKDLYQRSYTKCEIIITLIDHAFSPLLKVIFVISFNLEYGDKIPQYNKQDLNYDLHTLFIF